MDREQIIKGWEQFTKEYNEGKLKPRELTPLEKLQLDQMKAHDEYCKKATFILR